MDEIINPASPTIEPIPAITPKKKLQIWLLITSIFIIIIIIILSIIFNQKIKKKTISTTETNQISTSTPINIPTSPPTSVFEEGIFVGYINDELYMKQNGEIYYHDKDCGHSTEDQKELAKDVNNINWLKLENPKDMNSYRKEPFDCLFFPQFNKGIFILEREGVPSYSVFIYDHKSEIIKEIEPLRFTWSKDQKNTYNIPKIGNISKNGQSIFFYMYACWNCGGHHPEIAIYNIAQDKIIKRVGIVSDFEWLDGNLYRYKNYKEIPCKDDYPICYEDSSKLPYVTDSL